MRTHKLKNMYYSYQIDNILHVTIIYKFHKKYGTESYYIYLWMWYWYLEILFHTFSYNGACRMKKCYVIPNFRIPIYLVYTRIRKCIYYYITKDLINRKTLSTKKISSIFLFALSSLTTLDTSTIVIFMFRIILDLIPFIFLHLMKTKVNY